MLFDSSISAIVVNCISLSKNSSLICLNVTSCPQNLAISKRYIELSKSKDFKKTTSYQL